MGETPIRAVEMVRAIRDKIYEETKDLSREELKEFFRPVAGDAETGSGDREVIAHRRRGQSPGLVEATATARFLAAVPQFTVPDLVRTAEYYRDVLGFEIAGYWDGERASRTPEAPPVFAIVRRDEVQIFFNRADRSEVRTGRAQGAYDVYLNVTGIDALAAELRARGAEILDGPEDRVYGQRELVVRDCNGLVLAFGEEIGRDVG